MKKYTVRSNIEPEEKYVGKIIDRIWKAESIEEAKIKHKKAYPDCKIIWVKEAEEVEYNGPYFSNIRTIRGDIKELCDAELIQWLANATETHYCAGGHGKGRRNEVVANYYRKQLEKRDAKIPDTETLLDMGIFNGPGST